jgi:hypothetical protein
VNGYINAMLDRLEAKYTAKGEKLGTQADG